MTAENGTPQGDGTTPEPKAPPKSFTEDEVNEIVAKRLARDAKKFEGFDELKAKAARFDELEAANKTELERAQQAAADAQAKADKLAAQLKDANVKTALAAAVAAANTVDAALVIELSQQYVTVGDDGSVTGVEDAVKNVLTAKPYLVKKEGAPAPVVPSGNGDGGPRKTAQTPELEQLDIAAYMKARSAKASN